MLGAIGFENNYALARRRAQQLRIWTFEDLARGAPQLPLGTDHEF